MMAGASSPRARAADPASTQAATADPAFLQQILKRLEAQEAEIKALKEQLQKQSGSIDTLANADVTKKETFPQVSFHGFGNIDYRITDAKTGKNSFALGELDMFLDSRISENLKVLSETVLGAHDDTQEFGFEIERLLLEWNQSDYFNLDLGRYHTGIGYYNTAFHHGTWFQTAVGRPSFLAFEDEGGLIPAHNVGVSANGEIPSGTWGLRYKAEVGNGRPYHEATGKSPVLSVGDNNVFKAVNLALSIKPEWAPGLEAGAGVYHDTLTPPNVARTDEILGHAYVVYKNANWELLNEGEVWRHKTRDESAHASHAFFTQVGRKFGVFTPYARLSYQNASGTDSVWQAIKASGIQYGPSAGLRWDFSQFAAFKVQYDDIFRKGQDDLNQITLQASFTF